ncbi:hypothetical protein KIW84_065433 [Lathyrus oleraceus]|uniref:Uncharacterized protein n=1 Tax=Pisum sativum TaxID=3888 RepID=A0A9D4WF17_PEA|nr:hypothetical protein KIW84_065433 [Pisum sativum]
MLNRRSVSEIRCIEANGVKLTWVEEIKTDIFEHFRDRFKFVNTSRPLFHLADFNQIGEDDNNRLIAEFSEEEIKKKVWDCENSNSPDCGSIESASYRFFDFQLYSILWQKFLLSLNISVVMSFDISWSLIFLGPHLFLLSGPSLVRLGYLSAATKITRIRSM